MLSIPNFMNSCYVAKQFVISVYVAGADPRFSKGGAKLTQWRRMRCLSLRTHICMARHYFTNFSVTPPIFPSEEQKKNKQKRSQPTATRIVDHHLTFLQLLELPCAPFPSSHKDYLTH